MDESEMQNDKLKTKFDTNIKTLSFTNNLKLLNKKNLSNS